MGGLEFSDEPKESGCDWINRQKNGRLWRGASAKFSARSDGEDLRRTRLSLNRDRLAIVNEADRDSLSSYAMRRPNSPTGQSSKVVSLAMIGCPLKRAYRSLHS
jgi:hypothetical protein